MRQQDLDAVLNMDVINMIREMQSPSNPDLFARIVDLYINDSRHYVEDLQQACTVNDIETMLRAAHALKSSSANLGAIQVYSDCVQLESITHRDPHGNFTDLVHKIVLEYGYACATLNQMTRGETGD